MTADMYRSGGATAGNNPGVRNCIVTHALRDEGFDASEDGTGRGTPLVAHALNAKGGAGRIDGESETFIVEGDSAASTPDLPRLRAGCGRGGEIAVMQCHGSNVGPAGALRKGRTGSGGQGRNGDGIGRAGDPQYTLQAGAQHAVAFNRGREGGAQPEPDDLASVRAAVCFDENQVTSALNRSNPKPGDPAHPLNTCRPPTLAGPGVRRLLPRECERLQGFPDDWTLVPYNGKPAADSPRYKAIGNSMAVPVMRWIGERIAAVAAHGSRLTDRP